MGQRDIWDNKEEFQKKNHLLALLQTTCDGLQSAAIDRLKSETSLFIQALPGLLCERGWLALLSCQTFGMQSPSASKNTQGLREQAWTHTKAQRIGVGIAQNPIMPSKPAEPTPWAQTAQ
jgi:hypothetical protein